MELVFADDLNELLESASDVVSVREVTAELVIDLLRGCKRQLWVDSHRLVVRVSVFVRSNQEVDVVTQTPPNRRSLSVKEPRWQETQEVFTSLELQ